MYCTKCGQENTNKSNFCIRCGSVLNSGNQAKSDKIQISSKNVIIPMFIVGFLILVILILGLFGYRYYKNNVSEKDQKNEIEVTEKVINNDSNNIDNKVDSVELEDIIEPKHVSVNSEDIIELKLESINSVDGECEYNYSYVINGKEIIVTIVDADYSSIVPDIEIENMTKCLTCDVDSDGEQELILYVFALGNTLCEEAGSVHIVKIIDGRPIEIYNQFESEAEDGGLMTIDVQVENDRLLLTKGMKIQICGEPEIVDTIYEMKYVNSSWESIVVESSYDMIIEAINAYKDYMKNKDFKVDFSALITLFRLDDDIIPEVKIDGNGMAEGMIILSYHSGVVSEYIAGRHLLEYVPNSGYLINPIYHMGTMGEYVIKLDDDGFHFLGRYGHDENPDIPLYDDDGEIKDDYPYIYSWQEVQGTEEECRKKYEEAFPYKETDLINIGEGYDLHSSQFSVFTDFDTIIEQCFPTVSSGIHDSSVKVVNSHRDIPVSKINRLKLFFCEVFPEDVLRIMTIGAFIRFDEQDENVSFDDTKVVVDDYNDAEAVVMEWEGEMYKASGLFIFDEGEVIDYRYWSVEDDYSQETDSIFDNPFYGIWIGASKSEKKAYELAEIAKNSGLNAEVYLTTDWENLNKDPYYVISSGSYSTKEDAILALERVRGVYPDAYVKYSGEFIGEVR